MERAREIAALAKERGIRIDFEYHDHSLTDTNESAKRLIEVIGQPNVGTFWQTRLRVGHDYRLEGLKSLLDHVTNIHCNYFAENDWPNKFPSRRGRSEWSDYLSVLKESGQDRWISIEHVKNDSVESFKNDAETLNSWLSR